MTTQAAFYYVFTYFVSHIRWKPTKKMDVGLHGWGYNPVVPKVHCSFERVVLYCVILPLAIFFLCFRKSAFQRPVNIDHFFLSFFAVPLCCTLLFICKKKKQKIIYSKKKRGDHLSIENILLVISPPPLSCSLKEGGCTEALFVSASADIHDPPTCTEHQKFWSYPSRGERRSVALSLEVSSVRWGDSQEPFFFPAECQCLRPRGVCTINFTFFFCV